MAAADINAKQDYNEVLCRYLDVAVPRCVDAVCEGCRANELEQKNPEYVEVVQYEG